MVTYCSNCLHMVLLGVRDGDCLMRLDTFLNCSQCGHNVAINSYAQRVFECLYCGLKLSSGGIYNKTHDEWNRKQIEIAENKLHPCLHCSETAKFKFRGLYDSSFRYQYVCV